MERCNLELATEEYFGLPNTIHETDIVPNIDFGTLVDFASTIKLKFHNSLTDLASEFSLGKSKLYNRDVFIVQRANALTHKIYWAAMMERSKGWCLGKDDNWHFEYMPSSRTDEFISLTRFETKEQAYNAWIEHEKKGICLPLYA